MIGDWRDGEIGEKSKTQLQKNNIFNILKDTIMIVIMIDCAPHLSTLIGKKRRRKIDKKLIFLKV